MPDAKPTYDPDFTNQVINATGPKADPRLAQVVASFIRHVHDFARDVDLTIEEFMAGIALINRAGRMSDDLRNEGQLLADVIGLESLADEITSKKVVGASYAATKSAVLGPYFRKDAPHIANDGSIVKTLPPNGELTHLHGIVRDASTGTPLEGVIIDVWQCSANGKYEQEDPDQADFNLRGKLTTDKNGYYGVYCLRPVPYPIPHDGTAGELLRLLDRHPWRPAHIHILAGNDKYSSLVTQIFDKSSAYLDEDTVFAVKDELVAEFKPLIGNPKATLELVYDIGLMARKP